MESWLKESEEDATKAEEYLDKKREKKAVVSSRGSSSDLRAGTYVKCRLFQKQGCGSGRIRILPWICKIVYTSTKFENKIAVFKFSGKFFHFCQVNKINIKTSKEI